MHSTETAHPRLAGPELMITPEKERPGAGVLSREASPRGVGKETDADTDHHVLVSNATVEVCTVHVGSPLR